MIDLLLSHLKTAGLATFWPFYSFLFEGASRYYWVYCLTGVAMTLYAHHVNAGRAPGERSLFDGEVWMGKSAQNDYFIAIFGSVLRLTLLSWAFINWKPIAAFVVWVLHTIGVSGSVNDSAALGLGFALTVVLFVADDFMRWFMHYIMHAIPELWEFHKVHHSAEELNFMTAERIHPLEIVLTSLAAALVFGTVNGVFIAFFGDKLTVQTVFGANMFLVAFNVCGGVLRHSPVWISYGPRIERWVISPAMHQIHHSGEVRHFDKNMGGALAVWDRMFGTLYIPQSREITSFGIGEETADFRSLGVIYFRPFVRAWELIKSRMARASAATAEV